MLLDDAPGDGPQVFWYLVRSNCSVHCEGSVVTTPFLAFPPAYGLHKQDSVDCWLLAVLVDYAYTREDDKRWLVRVLDIVRKIHFLVG